MRLVKKVMAKMRLVKQYFPNKVSKKSVDQNEVTTKSIGQNEVIKKVLVSKTGPSTLSLTQVLLFTFICNSIFPSWFFMNIL